jgi:L-threonylcarbamoyladenylate synthase
VLRSGIEQAGAFIRGGGLVVFPTETVYGIGADAFNAEAVARIYSTKGRPGDNPLILHVANIESFKRLAYNPPEYAFDLIDKYWPGPLTLVAKKNPALPVWLGGHPQGKTETIGIRMPAHPVAQALLKESFCVIAAPSANKAGKPSPTTLAHVLEDFPESKNIFFLDGGNSVIGLESTVVDVTGESPVILRPGAVLKESIQGQVGRFLLSGRTFGQKNRPLRPPRSPGMKYKHSAPRAEMILLRGTPKKIASYVLEETQNSIGVLAHEKTLAFFADAPENIKILSLGGDEKTAAANLFSRLREFDRTEVKRIYAEAFPEEGLGAAIMDRMRKASEGRVINV